jgi:hypothetical protein
LPKKPKSKLSKFLLTMAVAPLRKFPSSINGLGSIPAFADSPSSLGSVVAT